MIFIINVLVDKVDVYGRRTALHYAAMKSHPTIPTVCEQLLTANASVILRIVV